MKQSTKIKIIEEGRNIFFVLLGCFILALADVLFIMPCNIVNGGIDSLAVIFNYFFSGELGTNISDIVIAIVQVVLWFIGLIFLGKTFSIHTLLGSLAFPAFYSILLRTNFISLIGVDQFYIANGGSAQTASLAALLVASILGGLLSGIGVAFTYLGDGSTGGFDIIAFIIEKYTDMKQDISGLILDSSMILIGLICLQNWALAFAGIISAIICAIAVNQLYVHANTSVIVDVLTENGEPINSFIQEKLERGTTLLLVKGGYSLKEKRIIRSVMYKDELSDLKEYVAMVDPSAFISVSEAKDITGEGFKPLESSSRSRRKILLKYGIKIKVKKKSKEEEEKEQEIRNSVPEKKE